MNPQFDYKRWANLVHRILAMANGFTEESPIIQGISDLSEYIERSRIHAPNEIEMKEMEKIDEHILFFLFHEAAKQACLVRYTRLCNPPPETKAEERIFSSVKDALQFLCIHEESHDEIVGKYEARGNQFWYPYAKVGGEEFIEIHIGPLHYINIP